VRPLDRVPFPDQEALSEEHDADALLLQIEGDPEHSAGKLEEFIGHDPVQPVDARDAVPDRSHDPDFADVHLGFVSFDLPLDDPGDLVGFYVHGHVTLPV